MDIKNKQGQVIYQSSFVTLKKTLESAAQEGACLRYADLRRARLSGVALEGVDLTGSCLWGADLSGCHMTGAILNAADMRMTTLKDSCFAEARLIKADLRGAHFAQTILSEADLSLAHISCPSFFSQNLTHVIMNGLNYWHRGEDHMVLDRPPVVISGLAVRVVLLSSGHLIGDTYYPNGDVKRSPAINLHNDNIAIRKIFPRLNAF